MEALTQADLLEALRAAFTQHPGPDDAFTSRELAKRFGRSYDWGCDRVRDLLESGAVERVKVRRTGIDGVEQPVTAYRLKANQEPPGEDSNLHTLAHGEALDSG